MKNYLMIFALGDDRPLLIKELTRVIGECECTIEDSRLVRLEGELAAIIFVQGSWNTLVKLELQLRRLEQTLNLTLLSKRIATKPPTVQTLPYAIEVVAPHQSEIIHHLADFFANHDIGIQDLTTRLYPAPYTGTMMFSVNIIARIPADTQIALLREEFMDFCDELNLDAVMEPLKG